IDLAKDVPAGADGLLFLPYRAGERSPNYAPAASGAFVGLLRMHGLGHLVRAVIEGALLNMREILEIFTAHGIRCERIVASGGEARCTVPAQTRARLCGSV